MGGLVLQITKEIGPESGMLRLIGVGDVLLPVRFRIAAVAAYDSPFPDCPHLELDAGEIAIAFQDADSHVHVIVAEAVQYEIEGEWTIRPGSVGRLSDRGGGALRTRRLPLLAALFLPRVMMKALAA